MKTRRGKNDGIHECTMCQQVSLPYLFADLHLRLLPESHDLRASLPNGWGAGMGSFILVPALREFFCFDWWLFSVWCQASTFHVVAEMVKLENAVDILILCCVHQIA